jgi:uncharacterized membrane protein
MRTARVLARTGLGTWPAALLHGALFAYALVSLHAIYRGGRFAFHDLALTNDYLANTVRHGRLFWAADYGLNHLGVHFSPTLLLVTPLYAVCESQFVLLAIGAVAYYAAVLFALRLFRRLVPAGFGIACDALAVLLVAALSMNLYARTVLVSAHFEVLFVLLALAVLDGLLHDAPLRRLLPLAVLTLGVREDAGLHLAGPLLATLFVGTPTDSAARTRLVRRVLVLVALAFAWVAIVVGLVMPAFGTRHAGYIVQFWGGLGDSPAAIVWTLVTSPRRVLAAVATGGFAAFNTTFGWIGVLRPLVFVLTNLSGIVFYVADEDAKRQLWYYNASFLIPGAVLATAAGCARLASLGRFVPVLAAATLAGLACVTMPSTVGGQLDLRPYPPADVGFFEEAITRDVASCPAVTSIATDFVDVVFVPNRYAKYMLINFAQADAVVLVRNASLMLRWGMGDADLVRAIETSGAFDRVHDDRRVVVYRKKALGCGTS